MIWLMSMQAILEKVGGSWWCYSSFNRFAFGHSFMDVQNPMQYNNCTTLYYYCTYVERLSRTPFSSWGLGTMQPYLLTKYHLSRYHSPNLMIFMALIIHVIALACDLFTQTSISMFFIFLSPSIKPISTLTWVPEVIWRQKLMSRHLVAHRKY